MRHGTLDAYTNKHCRCDDCRATWAEYQHARRTGTPWTGSTLVDAEPVRAHLLALRAAGWQVLDIAAESGYPTATIQSILRHNRRTRRETAEDLLALQAVAA